MRDYLCALRINHSPCRLSQTASWFRREQYTAVQIVAVKSHIFHVRVKPRLMTFDHKGKMEKGGNNSMHTVKRSMCVKYGRVPACVDGLEGSKTNNGGPDTKFV